MYRAIDLIAYQQEPSQQRRVGKPHFLRSKDLWKAFSGPETILGRTERGVYAALANLNKRHSNITLFLLAAEGNPMLVKDVIDSTFLSKDAGQVDLTPGELDLRQFADGIFSGRWYVYEEKGLSFAFLANMDFRIHLSKQEALRTFIKILDVLKERC